MSTDEERHFQSATNLYPRRVREAMIDRAVMLDAYKKIRVANITCADLAERLGCSPQQARSWSRDNRIPMLKQYRDAILALAASLP